MYYTRNKRPTCHSERSGITMQGRTRKPIIAAESNPEGAPAGGISALEYGITSNRIPPTNQVRSRTLQKRSTSQTDKKLPPRAPAQNKANQIFALHRRVLLGEVRGGSGRFGGQGEPLRKGSPCASKVFLPLSLLLPELQRRFSGGLLEALEKIRTALVPALPDDLVHGNFFPQ